MLYPATSSGEGGDSESEGSTLDAGGQSDLGGEFSLLSARLYPRGGTMSPVHHFLGELADSEDEAEGANMDTTRATISSVGSLDRTLTRAAWEGEPRAVWKGRPEPDPLLKHPRPDDMPAGRYPGSVAGWAAFLLLFPSAFCSSVIPGWRALPGETASPIALLLPKREGTPRASARGRSQLVRGTADSPDSPDEDEPPARRLVPALDPDLDLFRTEGGKSPGP
jgi:hypothetical protein